MMRVAFGPAYFAVFTCSSSCTCILKMCDLLQKHEWLPEPGLLPQVLLAFHLEVLALLHSCSWRGYRSAAANQSRRRFSSSACGGTIDELHPLGLIQRLVVFRPDAYVEDAPLSAGMGKGSEQHRRKATWRARARSPNSAEYSLRPPPDSVYRSAGSSHLRPEGGCA